jgi:REP element-mobilizing transposase RayT
MPRGPRLDAPGVVHHVMARGIERRQLFRGDADREDFVARLDALCVDGDAALYAWCLLPNHFHLLVRTGAAPLSNLMRRLLTGYAGAFNRRHRRAGHLLQNRFKSIVVDEESYLLELVRYIHLNPVRAGVVADTTALVGYALAGHGAAPRRHEAGGA